MMLVVPCQLSLNCDSVILYPLLLPLAAWEKRLTHSCTLLLGSCRL